MKVMPAYVKQQTPLIILNKANAYCCFTAYEYRFFVVLATHFDCSTRNFRFYSSLLLTLHLHATVLKHSMF